MPLKIKTSAKIKRRYFLIKGTKKEVENALLDYLGLKGWVHASIVFVSTQKSHVIVSVGVRSVDDVHAACTLSASDLKVERVSSTLKSLDSPLSRKKRTPSTVTRK